MFGILHICDYAAAYKGNFILSLLELEDYLKDKSINQVYLFPHRAKSTKAINWINELIKEGHTVYILNENNFKNILLLKKIKNQHNIKTVFRHFNNTEYDLLTKLVFGGKNTVHFFHSMYKPGSKIKNSIKQFLFYKNTLVGVSQAVSNVLKESFKNEVITVSNAVNFERLDTYDVFKSKSKISCLVMGYDILSKGTDLAIDAVSKIQEKYDLHLYIVTASHLIELESLLEKKGVKNAQWLSILPPTENIATYYKNTDIFLAPSRFEGFSYALVEASYCKSTPVFSDISAHRLLKIDDRFMFKNESLDDFLIKVENAIQEKNSQNSLEIKEKIKNDVIKEYSIKNWCKKVYELI